MPRKSHENTPKIKKAAAVAALSALAIGSAIGLNERSNDNTENYFSEIEQEAIKNIETARNSIVVVTEEATYRTTPFTVSENEAGLDTVAGKVPEGRALRIINGVEHRDTNNDLWIGFNLRGENEARNSAKAEDLNWINMTELERQSDPNKPYVTEFRRADAEARPTPNGISIGVSADQQFTSSGKDGGPEIGSAEIMSNAELLQELSNESLLVNG